MMLVLPILLAMAAPAAERMVLPVAPGFVVVHRETAQTGSIEERVPRGETINKWSRMITLLRLNTSSSPETYLADFGNRVSGACP